MPLVPSTVYAILRPILFALDPEVAHRLAMAALRWIGAVRPLRRFAELLWGSPSLPRLRTRLFGLELANPIGLAAGLDKDATALAGLSALGFGFVEVGTVTPQAQPGNPRPRLFRLPPDRALINRMGFNNRGAAAMARALRAPHRCPVGVNLGMNKETPLDHAPADYLTACTALREQADYLVVNVSSPNTPGLRDLQSRERLEAIVQPLLQARAGGRPPILVKLAPDMPDDEVVDLARACERWGIDGLVIANTTLGRSDLASSPSLTEQAGGLSGAPLRARSVELIRAVASATRLPIIGVGGIFTAADAYQMIRAGASAVQLYTALIYEGPGLPRRIAMELAGLLEQGGFTSVADAVGADLKRGGSA